MANISLSILDGRLYVIRVSSHSSGHGKIRTLNSAETSYTVEGLKPYTLYEFTVKVTKGNKESSWSMTAINTTFVAG